MSEVGASDHTVDMCDIGVHGETMVQCRIAGDGVVFQSSEPCRCTPGCSVLCFSDGTEEVSLTHHPLRQSFAPLRLSNLGSVAPVRVVDRAVREWGHFPPPRRSGRLNPSNISSHFFLSSGNIGGMRSGWSDWGGG